MIKRKKMSNSYIKNFLIEKKSNFQQEMTSLLLPMFNNWKGGIIKLFCIELGRGVYPKGRNWNSGIETRLAIEKLGRSIHPLGRNWNSGLVTKFTIEKFGEGSSSPNKTDIVFYFLEAVAVKNNLLYILLYSFL